MKYYMLTSIGVDRKISGVAPQSVTGIHGDLNKDFLPNSGIIDFEFNLPEVFLQKKAKLTSLINTTWVTKKFLVIDHNLLSCLQTFDIGDYQSWLIKVHHNDIIYSNYNLFRLTYCKQREYVDFDKSEFFVGSLKDYKFVGDKVKVYSFDNYLSTQDVIKQDGYWLKYKNVVVNLKNAHEDLICFNISPLGNYFVSERLREAIKKNNLTGMIFKEIDAHKNISVIY